MGYDREGPTENKTIDDDNSLEQEALLLIVRKEGRGGRNWREREMAKCTCVCRKMEWRI